MTVLDKFIDHINTNAGDYKEFVKLLMESNIQTKDTYKQLLDILPDEEYKKILAKFLVLNKRKIESVTKKVVLLNELNDIYNNLDKSLYTSKIIKKIDIKYAEAFEEIKETGKDDCVNVFKKYVSSKCFEGLKKQRKFAFLISCCFAVFIGLFMLVGSIPVVDYELIGDEAKVTGMKGLIFPFYFEAKDVKVKEKYRGARVTIIGQEAFANSDMESVTLPKTIVQINSFAFYNCQNLKHVNSYIGKTLHEDTINCEYIMYQAFAGCEDLGQITITSSLKEIKYDTFTKTEGIVINYEGSSTEWRRCGGNRSLDVNYSKYFIIIYSSDGARQYTQVVEYGQMIDYIDLSGIYTHRGYKITGLYDESNNKAFKADGHAYNPITITKDLELYYSISRINIKISVHDANISCNVFYGDLFKLDYVEKDGYIFKGYYTAPDGQGERITDEKGASLSHSQAIQNYVVYPYYVEDCFTLEYKDGTSLKIYEGNEFTIPVYEEEKNFSGLVYKFEGYYLGNINVYGMTKITDETGSGVSTWEWNTQMDLYACYVNEYNSSIFILYDELIKNN